MAWLKHRLFRLLALVVVAAWFLCPLPETSAIKTVDVQRPGSPSSAVVEERIVCTRASDEILLRLSPQLTTGRVQVDLLDLDGKVLAGPLVLTGHQRDIMTFVTDGGFPLGRAYRVRCAERGVVGSYRLAVSQPWKITVAQRYVAGVLILAIGLLVTAGFGSFRIGGTGMRRMAAGFAWYLFLATFWLVYPMVHEAGHIVALRVFDAWQPGGTSLLPLGGQTPHVSGNPAAHLAPWQIAVAAIAGGLLPTLLGYASFAVWASRLGRKWRAQGLRADLGWCAFTLMLVFPQAVPVPMLFPHVIHDRDYALFIQNVGLPLCIANSGLAVIAVINLAVVAWLGRHLFLRIRTARRANQTVQRTGASRPDQQANTTSSAAGSRR
jgi:hypothetical protein